MCHVCYMVYFVKNEIIPSIIYTRVLYINRLRRPPRIFCASTCAVNNGEKAWKPVYLSFLSHKVPTMTYD